MSAALLRLVVAGASGRMGRMLIEAITQAPDCALVGALEHSQSPVLGHDAGAFAGLNTGVTIQADVAAALQGADCLIDFTRPEGTVAHAAVAAQAGVAMVIGTTGFDDQQKAAIAQAATRVGVVMAPNMSVGVNVTLKLLETAARALPEGFDIEVIEAHHRHKVDAPSGTALRMGEVVADALGRDFGDIVGDHTVLFAGTGERIEITHKSSSRATYAQGSLRAARFLSKHPAGLYDMFDVLGLR
jgi:4-hydroxy-tetrahydrodipicolinate reductase